MSTRGHHNASRTKYHISNATSSPITILINDLIHKENDLIHKELNATLLEMHLPPYRPSQDETEKGPLVLKGEVVATIIILSLTIILGVTAGCIVRKPNLCCNRLPNGKPRHGSTCSVLYSTRLPSSFGHLGRHLSENIGLSQSSKLVPSEPSPATSCSSLNSCTNEVFIPDDSELNRD